ncbi:MAG: hypothetical protein KKA07_05770 [Bacteroidetes bacterium]|nr:hypothetical protein [Bacteroidota bacterium]
METMTGKREYQTPRLMKHQLDTSINLIMMSDPPGDPPDAVRPNGEKDTPFRDNPFE